MFYFITIIIGGIILKFIYDSYFTNKTNRDWAEYKQKNPSEAIVIENSKGLDFSTSATLRFHGYYLGKHRLKSNEGGYIELYYILVFSENGFSYLWQNLTIAEYEEWKKDDFTEIEKDLSAFTDEDLSEDSCKYLLRKNEIFMVFDYYSYDIDGYKTTSVINQLRWEGTVIKNGLILSSGDSWLEEGQYTYHNIKFDFIDKRK
ncbi:hypothetical protein [Flavobacterium sp. JP2137]|uniref:hypothetical protein n=1 Tax=Flavobacterium sp. JP2137 TaxID=3414510 RepID=UPI003D2FE750